MAVLRPSLVVAALLVPFGADPARGEPTVVRIATFNIRELQAPKLDQVDSLGRGTNEQLRNAAEIIQRVRPDVLLINEIDYDATTRRNAREFVSRYLNVSQGEQVPIDYPFEYFAPVNSGIPSGYDLDNDGISTGPADALGYGLYPGHFGMVLLSRWPLDEHGVRTFRGLRWRSMPGHTMPDGRHGRPKWYSRAEAELLPLSSKSHWDVPMTLGCQTIHLLCTHPSPPAYDGVEDHNGRRNNDEVRFWVDYLAGGSRAGYIVDDRGLRGPIAPDAEFVLLGDLNADPLLSAGDFGEHAIVPLLNGPRVFDPVPTSPGALHGRSAGHPDFLERRTHEVARIDYVLPSRSLDVVGSGVFWPSADDPLSRLVSGESPSSNHRLVWLDVRLRCAARSLNDLPTWVVQGGAIANTVVATPAGAPDPTYSLPFPANMGVIPQTRRADPRGGDDAPVDVIILGPALPAGFVAPVRLIGLIRIIESGLRAEKVLAVQPSDVRLGHLRTLGDLERDFPGTLGMLEGWLTRHADQPGRVQIVDRGDVQYAERAVERSRADFIAASQGRLVESSAEADPGAGRSGFSAMRLVMPKRMVSVGPLTLRAELLDDHGQIDWRTWHALGTVAATRVDDGRIVPIRTTVFETVTDGAGGGLPPANGVRFYNGVGSVSFLLANGAAEPVGEIDVSVSLHGVTAKTRVSVVDTSAKRPFRTLEGPLSDGDLVWSPDDGVIRLTGTVRVPPSHTLKILPGTLVMVDPGPDGMGTAVEIAGAVEARGTAAEPIYFFPSSGAAAMMLPQDQHNNPSSWRGLWHSGDAKSVYSYVFVVGAGNGPTQAHPRPPVFRLADGHSIEVSDSTLVDSPGKMLQGSGHGTYRFSRCLFSRLGIGGEFWGENHELLVEDSWFTRIGRAPASAGTDGDMLHLGHATSRQTVRRCILTDGGDDAIDHVDARPTIEDVIIYDIFDKAVSLTRGSIKIDNALIFQTRSGVRGSATISDSTILVESPVDCPVAVERTIIWPRAISTCAGRVNHSLVGLPCGLGSGTGNISGDPMFRDVAAFDFRLGADSPAKSAGPRGGPIGWRGFPGIPPSH